jgi:dihydroneopterin aldolase
VNVDDSDPNNVVVYGDFWINNYNIDGDTLSCVSGGDYPGVMHVSKDGDTYTVSSFDMVADGSGFEASAKELFGDNYDAFMKVYSDDVTRAVNYLTCYEVVREQMAITQHTIERVAQNIIRALHARFPQTVGIECRVTKLAPPLGGKVARVSVTLCEEY